MKKGHVLFLIIVFATVNLSATTYTSAKDGAWNDIMTWSPWGLPTTGDIVTINHSITLNVPIYFLSGSITVNLNGTLTEDSPSRYILLDGPNATFVNHGTSTVNSLVIWDGFASNSGNLYVRIIDNSQTIENTGEINTVNSLRNSGTINNDGIIKVKAFLNTDTINNYGAIQGLTTVVDSMFNAGVFLNDVGALLRADSCTNSNTFTNNGVVNFDQFTNTGTITNTNYLSFVDVTNTGTFINQDSLIGLGSMLNTGSLDNQAGAVMSLAVSFLNSDPVNFDALLTINGSFTIGDSYYNFDTINGTATGSITLQDTSFNSGVMSGSFDFCDMTPPATSPFVDINLGTVSPGITHCVVGIATNNNDSEITIYPNPTNGIINIESDENLVIEIYDFLGKQLISSIQNRVSI